MWLTPTLPKWGRNRPSCFANSCPPVRQVRWSVCWRTLGGAASCCVNTHWGAAELLEGPWAWRQESSPALPVCALWPGASCSSSAAGGGTAGAVHVIEMWRVPTGKVIGWFWGL